MAKLNFERTYDAGWRCLLRASVQVDDDLLRQEGYTVTYKTVPML